jgi:hypothetical protein
VSSLGKNDAYLHYEDGSHRWTDPLGVVDDEAWRATVEAHLAEHRKSLGGEGPGWPGRLRKRGTSDPHA